MRRFSLLSRMLVLVTCLCQAKMLYAWHNDFSIVNNTDEPLSFVFETDQGGAHPDPLCDNGKAVPPQRSCHIQLTDSFKFPEGSGHKGKIVLSKSNGERCVVHYQYLLNELSYSKKRTVNLSIEQCSGGFDTRGLSFVNDEIKTKPRPMLYLLELPFISNQLLKSSESYALADCADPTTGEEVSDNCVVVTPTPSTLLHSTAISKAMAIQNDIDKFEPLDKAQWIGSHNSTIGPHYTHSKQLANMSYSDPNNIASLKEQLDSGVTQIEFDVLWDRGGVKLCHNHLNIPKPLDKVISNVMCDNNAALSDGVGELKSWLMTHPDKVIVVLLDVNQALKGHEAEITSILSSMEDKIFLPLDAERLFKKKSRGKTLPPHTLPTSYLTKDDILKTGKQVIFVVDAEESYFSEVKYVFLHNYNNGSDLLYQHGAGDFFASPDMCSGAQKYTRMQTFYNHDQGHFNIWRSNGDRTLVGYLNSTHGNTSRYNHFLSLATIKQLRRCPLNILSLNMLGFSCNQSNMDDCKYGRASNRPIDPRVTALLWSWDIGFPLEADSHTNHQAFLVQNKSKTGIHFQNGETLTLDTPRVLCHVDKMTLKQLGPDEWFTVPLVSGETPQTICEKSKGVFATPVTSYQMDDVWLRLKSEKGVLNAPVLVNYHFDAENGWLANNGNALPAPIA